MSDCNCTLAQKLVGDGCRECNPQFWIDHLEEYVKELQEEKQALKQRLIDAAKNRAFTADRYYVVELDDLLDIIDAEFSDK